MYLNKQQEQLIQMIQTGDRDHIALALMLAESQAIDLNDFLYDCSLLLAPQPVQPPHLAVLFSQRELEWAHPLLWLPAYCYQASAKAERLAYLHPAIGWLEQLEYLDLSNHFITDLPPQIGRLKNLRALRVNNNQLRSLPAEIGRLRYLEQLELSVNQLKDFPEEIGQLERLDRLQLDYNPISLDELDRLQALLPHTRIYARRETNLFVVRFGN
jgi:hypothetical protein